MASNGSSVSAPLLSALGRSWWVLLLYGIVGVLFGIVAMTSPVEAAAGMTWALGLLALIDGIVSVFALFDKQSVLPKGWLVLYAIASLLFGVVALMNPLAMAGALVIFLAAWLIVGGIYRIVLAIQIRKEIEGEWMIILSGVLSIILGVLFMASPSSGLIVTAMWIGVIALIYGVLQIVGAFKLRKLANP